MKYEADPVSSAKLNPVPVVQLGFFHSNSIQIRSLFAAQVVQLTNSIVYQNLGMRSRNSLLA